MRPCFTQLSQSSRASCDRYSLPHGLVLADLIAARGDRGILASTPGIPTKAREAQLFRRVQGIHFEPCWGPVAYLAAALSPRPAEKLFNPSMARLRWLPAHDRAPALSVD
jgi:hypothetical protein